MDQMVKIDINRKLKVLQQVMCQKPAVILVHQWRAFPHGSIRLKS